MNSEKICKQIIEHLVASGWKHQVRQKDVETAIMRIRGVDQRTKTKWLEALIVFEYLKPVAPRVYQVNPLQVPDLFQRLKEKPQTTIQ